MGLEITTGGILGYFYRPDILNTHSSVVAMHDRMRLLQSFHYWDSALLIVESLGLVCWLVWTGRYRVPFQAVFWSSLLFFLSAFGFQISGNVLPFDRHGVETAVVESGIAARAPLVGSQLRTLMLDGPSFGASTLKLWIGAHLLLLVLPLVAFGLLLNSRQKLSIGRKTYMGLGTALLPAILLVALVPSPLGSAATEQDYGTFGAMVSWYTWPLHGAMEMLDRLHQGFGWIGSMAIPGLAALALLTLPFWGKRFPTWVPRTGMLACAAFFGAGAFLFGGSFAPLTGTRDPALQAASSTTKAAPIDAALEAQGAKLFAAQSCANCHGANGDAGGSGPSLKLVGRQHPDPQFFVKYVNRPTSIDPQSTMPPFPNLGATQLQAIAEYLRSKK